MEMGSLQYIEGTLPLHMLDVFVLCNPTGFASTTQANRHWQLVFRGYCWYANGFGCPLLALLILSWLTFNCCRFFLCSVSYVDCFLTTCNWIHLKPLVIWNASIISPKIRQRLSPTQISGVQCSMWVLQNLEYNGRNLKYEICICYRYENPDENIYQTIIKVLCLQYLQQTPQLELLRLSLRKYPSPNWGTS